MLTTRVLYMTYFFFMVMLVFSNSVLLYSSLFRGKETPWLLTTPLSPRAIFLWKTIESFLVSSWGLAILSAPILRQRGTHFRGGAGILCQDGHHVSPLAYAARRRLGHAGGRAGALLGADAEGADARPHRHGTVEDHQWLDRAVGISRNWPTPRTSGPDLKKCWASLR